MKTSFAQQSIVLTPSANHMNQAVNHWSQTQIVPRAKWGL